MIFADAMSTERRLNIFYRYSNHLNLLVSEGILSEISLDYEKTYICPICLGQYSEEHLNQESENPLTLEDVPPKSLGGKANILTCKACNNRCGQKFDHYLSSVIKELDKRDLVPGTTFNAHIFYGDNKLQGSIQVDEDGTLRVEHKEKHNNPRLLNPLMSQTKKGDEIRYEHLDLRLDLRKLRIAVLKVAYLSTFMKYGYSFILDPIYDPIRQQLLNPQDEIYDSDYFGFPKSILPDLPSDNFLAPFVISVGIESVMPIFSVEVGIQRMMAGVLPLPYRKSGRELMDEIRKVLKNSGSAEFSFDPMPGDYLFDLIAIRHMLKWIYGA